MASAKAMANHDRAKGWPEPFSLLLSSVVTSLYLTPAPPDPTAFPSVGEGSEDGYQRNKGKEMTVENRDTWRGENMKGESQEDRQSLKVKNTYRRKEQSPWGRTSNTSRYW